MAKSNVLNTLRAAEAAALRTVERGQRELNGIRAAIVAVAGSLAGSMRGRGRTRVATAVEAGKRKRSRMSAAARRAVSLRMKKYWAARRAGAKK
jgi:hypothetical protein